MLAAADRAPCERQIPARRRAFRFPPSKPCATGDNGVGQNASGHRAVDIDVFWPASLVAAIFQPNSFSPEWFSISVWIAYPSMRSRGRRGIEAGEFGPGAPMLLQDFRGRGDLVFVEHGGISQKFS
jgi:hypothetical protein